MGSARTHPNLIAVIRRATGTTGASPGLVARSGVWQGVCMLLPGRIADYELADHYRLASVFALPSEKEVRILFLEALGCRAGRCWQATAHWLVDPLDDGGGGGPLFFFFFFFFRRAAGDPISPWPTSAVPCWSAAAGRYAFRSLRPVRRRLPRA